ncbi:MAG: alpha/beta fold hydrolase, partial [Rhodospirillales bacterium]
SKDIFAASRIAAELTEQGVAVLRFDFTGLGASEGEFANTNFTSNVDDLVAAYQFMAAEHAAPRILIGHSLGGAAVLVAAAQMPDVQAVCTIAAPSDPEHVKHNFDSAIKEIESKGEAEVQLVGRSFRIRRQFLDDIASQNVSSAIGKLRKALLIFHSPVDQTVGIDNAAAIYTAAKHPKSFISLDDADHLLSRKSDAVYVASVISAWSRRYIDSASSAKDPSITAEEGKVLVAEAGDGPFAQHIAIGPNHLIRADEPKDIGGLDTGPTPYGLLAASLGACTSMTIRMYAGRKKWPLEKVSVTLSHAKDHASDCEDCDSGDARIDHFDRVVDLVGDLTGEQRQKLLEIADKCPVHRTLHSKVEVTTELAGSRE